jgi:hypothetical protein
VPNHTACLAHLTDLDRNAYLATLATGTEIDHLGTPFTAQLLGALQDPSTQCAHFQSAWFDEAQFFGVADFKGARFSGNLVESAQARWRAVTAPHLVVLVRAGARFETGHLAVRPEEAAAA